MRPHALIHAMHKGSGRLPTDERHVTSCLPQEAEPALFNGSVWASPCDTSYADTSAADVVVIEPPHRGDRNKDLDRLPFHLMIKRSFRVAPERRADFLARFTLLLEEFGV